MTDDTLRRTILLLCQRSKQEAQLSQRNNATAAWVSFDYNMNGRRYSAPNFIGLSSTTVT